MYYVNTIGEVHYGETPPKIWDVCHKYLPNLYRLGYLSDLLPSLLFIPLLFSPDKIPDVLSEYIKYYPIIVILRSIMIFVTIMPKYKRCKHSGITWKSYVFGHCYDKIFSGHTAFIFLLTLIYLKHGVLNIHQVILINMVNSFMILSNRGHYTIDILVAYCITYMVYTNY